MKVDSDFIKDKQHHCIILFKY